MSASHYSPGESYAYALNIKKILKTPLTYSPQVEIVYRDRWRYTYTALVDRIRRLAGTLRELGVRPADTVAVLDYDSHRYLECFFAIPMLGAVMQTVNWRLSPRQVLYTLDHAGAQVVLVHADFLPLFESIRSELGPLTAVVTVAEGDTRPSTLPAAAAEYEALLAQARPLAAFPDLDENAKATTFYTTGTTGKPKGVYFSHRQIVLHTLAVTAATAAYDTIGRFRSNDVYMPLTPMFHVHAWGFPYVATLLGAKQVYPGPYEPLKLLELIDREKVTFSHCVPTVLQMLLSHPAAREVDLSGWKVIIGGARLPKGLARTAMDHGIEIHAGYGLSETCPVMTLAMPGPEMSDWSEEQRLDVIVKAGKPIPLSEVEVTDPAGEILPHDGRSTGEVVMRSPWLTESYFKEPEQSRSLWRRGWMHTGDVGHLDGNGYLLITDRIKDVIKSGGEWISSLDLENLMSQHEAVLESAAIGVPDDRWGERPLMIVTLRPEFQGRIGVEEFRTYMRQCAAQGKLPRYAVPERYRIVDGIPKTSVGKLDKILLRKRFGDLPAVKEPD